MGTTITMNVVNDHAAGIDIGSREHFVAVGQQPGDVRSFRTYHRDHAGMIAWLKGRRITTIAMESTGNYWQTLFSALQEAGFEVLLVNGRQIKNVKGKTDVKDCQWIQRLHSLGLLRGSFLPSPAIEQLRTYQRHRSSLIEQCARFSNKMQKTLRLMNVRLDIAISDVMGKSGRTIIAAILAGERDGNVLANLAHWKVKKSKDELAAALTGNWKEEQFILAIREGKFKGLAGGRSLLPPMPWDMYRHFTDDELKAIFAYLKSTAPINNVVPAPLPPVKN